MLNKDSVVPDWVHDGKLLEFVIKDEPSYDHQCLNGCYFYGILDGSCPKIQDQLICDKDLSKVWKPVQVHKKSSTPNKTENPNKGRKYDSDKPMYNLLPADALEEVVKVLTVGAKKYNEPIDQENWRLIDNPQPRYFAAAQRHLWADQRGDLIDKGTPEAPGTNCYHLACAISSLLFKLQLRIEKEKQ